MAVRGTTAWQYAVWGRPCRPQKLTKLTLHGGGIIHVDARAVSAYRALNACLVRHNYRTDRTQTGAYNCRKKVGASSMSNHSWATAVDLNWRRNPFLRGVLITDMPLALIQDIYRIKTVGGQRVFRWGGDWNSDGKRNDRTYDTMHFEIIASPGELARGVMGPQVTPPRPSSDTSRSGGGQPLLKEGAGIGRLSHLAGAVRQLQAKLKQYGFAVIVDGKFGPGTHRQVVAFQRSRRLSPDGIVGPATWKALS